MQENSIWIIDIQELKTAKKEGNQHENFQTKQKHDTFQNCQKSIHFSAKLKNETLLVSKINGHFVLKAKNET